MSSQPDVTVVMPAYNTAAYVGEAVRSVLDQEGVSLRLIVVDDGSPDGTAEIVEAIDDPRIELLRREHRGLVPALNEACARASTPFVARQDSDDIARAHRLATQLAYLRAHPSIDLTGCLVERLRGTSYLGTSPPDLEACSAAALRWRLYFRNPFPGNTLFARTEAIRSGGPFDEEALYAEDYEFCCRNRHRLTLGAVLAPLGIRREHGGSVTASQPAVQRASIVRAHHRMLEEELGPGVDRQAAFALRYPFVARDARALDRAGALLLELEQLELSRPGLSAADAALIRADATARLRGMWYRRLRRAPLGAPAVATRWVARERLGAARSAAGFLRRRVTGRGRRA